MTSTIGNYEQLRRDDTFDQKEELKQVPLFLSKELPTPELDYQGVRMVPDLSKGNVVVRTALEAKVVDLCIQNPRKPGETSVRFQLHEAGDSGDGGKLFAGSAPLRFNDIYGFRVAGEYDPPYQLFNYNNLLADPYAHQFDFLPSPFSVVADISSLNRKDYRPKIDPSNRVIYEAHVGSETMGHPRIPRSLQGTYQGFVHPAHLEHLKSLGVNAIEFLPFQQFITEQEVGERGLQNEWGYNTLGFFAPHVKYSATGRPIPEIARMIDVLHRNGFQVYSDIVLNHTAEGGAAGPILHLKGLDNVGNYWLNKHGNYLDNTGCGNTLKNRRLMRDALRFWGVDMQVDGFRFDLASPIFLDRYEDGNYKHGGTHLDGSEVFYIDQAAANMMPHRDPELKKRNVITIVEPWGGIGGFALQAFSHERGVTFWNSHFRDRVRDFWRGELSIADYADVLTGTRQSLGLDVREFPEVQSLNFVTAHDGFSLHDLTAYNTKHNGAHRDEHCVINNREGNRDGTDDNHSWNRGIEGPSKDRTVIEERLKAAANMLLALCLADGTPMIRAGDQLFQTQHGNNNPFCHRIPLPWQMDDDQRYIFQLWQAGLNLRRTNDRLGAIEWLNHEGAYMQTHQWGDHSKNVVGMYRESKRVGQNVLYLVNGNHYEHVVQLPRERKFDGGFWQLINTGTKEVTMRHPISKRGQLVMSGLSTIILQR